MSFSLSRPEFVWRGPKRGHIEADHVEHVAFCGKRLRDMRPVPLSAVAPEDLCRACVRSWNSRTPWDDERFVVEP